MEQYEDWSRLLQELPGMVRFGLIFYGIVSVLILAGLGGIVIQLHRLVGALNGQPKNSPAAHLPNQPGPHQPPYGQPQPQQQYPQQQPQQQPPGNNPYYPPRQP